MSHCILVFNELTKEAVKLPKASRINEELEVRLSSLAGKILCLKFSVSLAIGFVELLKLLLTCAVLVTGNQHFLLGVMWGVFTPPSNLVPSQVAKHGGRCSKDRQK